MGWLPEYDNLDTLQRSFIEDRLLNEHDTANYWIQGFPGTGKSVVLVHGLIKYRQKYPSARIALVLFTPAMIELVSTAIPKEIRKTVTIIPSLDFVNQSKPYDVIFADEVQDFLYTVINAMLFRAKRVILAGDPNLSISQFACDTQYILLKLKPEIFLLNTVHRSQNNTVLLAANFYENPKLAKQAEAIENKVTDITLQSYSTYAEEAADIWRNAKEFAQNGFGTAVLVPNHYEMIRVLSFVLHLHEAPSWHAEKVQPGNTYDYQPFNSIARKCRIPAQIIGTNANGSLLEMTKRPMVSFLTYQCAKGLDFDILFLPFLSRKIIFWRDDIRLAKALFVTAVTRSRKYLHLSCNETQHPFLERIPPELFKKQDIPEIFHDFNNGAEADSDRESSLNF